MRLHLLSVLALSSFALAPVTNAARVAPEKEADVERDIDLRGRVVRPYDPSDPRDNFSRVIDEKKRRVVEPDGSEVIVTRRLHEEPDGDILVEETRQEVPQ